MLLKRIHAPSLPEALRRVEQECGKNALLVETRQTRRGFTVIAAAEAAVVVPRPARNAQRSAGSAGSAGKLRWTRGFQDVATRALEFGLGATVLRAVENALIGTAVELDRPGDPALERVAARVLKALIKTMPLELPRFRVTALIGATGVGKTTTLAKLAATAVRDRGESLVIVTTDTYRIAAVEQLRAFADMISVPFEVAFTPADLQRIVRQQSDAERILIDTSGRSPLDRESLAKLRGTLEGCRPATLLCLPAGARRVDLEASIDGFDVLDPDAVILTKWDETSVPGESLSVAIERGLPITHVTVGQEVPDDIVVADSGVLAASALSLAEAEAEALL